jgi:hypothetical protein
MSRLVLGTGEERLGQQSEWHPLGHRSEREMHPKAALMLTFVPDGTQSLGLRMTGVVQKTGVLLDGKHLLVLRYSLHRPLVMRCADTLPGHFFVIMGVTF